MLLAIRRDVFALGTEQKCRVESFVIIGTGRAGPRFGIVRAEDHPDLVRGDEIGDGAKIVPGKIRHRGLGPDQQVGFCCERQSGQFHDFVETIRIPNMIPDDLLTNARLNQRDL